MKPRLLGWIGISGAALCTVGCAGSFDPANFEGTREARRAEAEAVIDVAARTSEMETLGSVRDGCRLSPGFRRIDGELLSDVDCSTERLLIALHESAANAGGEILIGAHCSSRRLSTASRETYLLRCGAQVARYVGPEPSPLSPPRSRSQGRPAPSPSDVRRIDEPDASLSFRISVSFEPAVASYEHPVLRSEQVQELPRLPVSHHAIGDLAAHCDDGCDERALRYGVLIAAGRLGAPDVVDVRCFGTDSGSSCVGTLAAPERSD